MSIKKDQTVLISSRIIHDSNSNQIQLRKMSQLSILQQESKLRFSDAGKILLPLSYKGSWKEQAWLMCIERW